MAVVQHMRGHTGDGRSPRSAAGDQGPEHLVGRLGRAGVDAEGAAWLAPCDTAPPAGTGQRKEPAPQRWDAATAVREFARNKARIEDGQTFRARQPTGWKLGGSPSTTGETKRWARASGEFPSPLVHRPPRRTEAELPRGAPGDRVGECDDLCPSTRCPMKSVIDGDAGRILGAALLGGDPQELIDAVTRAGRAAPVDRRAHRIQRPSVLPRSPAPRRHAGRTYDVIADQKAAPRAHLLGPDPRPPPRARRPGA